VEHVLLPGYVLPPEPGTARVPAPEFAQLMKQVDALMELVTGEPVGVRAA